MGRVGHRRPPRRKQYDAKGRLEPGLRVGMALDGCSALPSISLQSHYLVVNIGSRVVSNAEANGVLVSQTVRDLVAGSGIRFTDRGAHELKGIPGSWHSSQSQA